ncbi:hypothetical protein [Nostoc sp. ATCC 53789]|uniref:hypothetical protein n=1 Tax=Nostoc sp. ATCC 53789 TaxID=76335 RepID=UPI000DED2A62|nr:hypothetical protein [Nostoc sp. ATCC 53789]QHG18975.1 hypothetical protein GJB62_25425 [Nostoc sp. ATCC 53789]RCJ17472.1 hypothetical protein A6V25_29355 [Nostoc sp. ATCC 53789]
MLKYTKYILGATLFSIGTLTVVYAAFPTKLHHNNSNLVLTTSEKVTLNAKSGILLADNELAFTPQLRAISDTVQPITDFIKDGLMLVIVKMDANSVRQVRQAANTGSKITNFLIMNKILKNENLIARNLEKRGKLRHLMKVGNENFSTIQVNYATNLQVAQQQQTEQNKKILADIYIIYAGVRRNLTFTNTFINTREKPGAYKQADKLQSQASTYLKNNIEDLSDYQKLKQEFTNKIVNSAYINQTQKIYADNVLEIINFMEKNKGHKDIINIEQQVRKQMLEEQGTWSQKIAQIVEDLQNKEEIKKTRKQLQTQEEVMPVLW